MRRGAKHAWGGCHRAESHRPGQAWVKRRPLVEAAGGPLAVVVAGANVQDTKLLAATLEAVVVERPQPSHEEPQHLCLDNAADNPTGWETVATRLRAAYASDWRGEAGCPRREAFSRQALGGGTDAGLAKEMPRHFGAL